MEPGTALRQALQDAVVCVDEVRVTHQGGSLQIGTAKQIFVGLWAKDGRDVFLVESLEDIEMTMDPAHVTGERLGVQDKPWEGAGILDMRLKSPDALEVQLNGAFAGQGRMEGDTMVFTDPGVRRGSNELLISQRNAAGETIRIEGADLTIHYKP